MNLSDIVTAINKAECELNGCFNYLMAFKHGKLDNADPILLFQPKLADCLYELMKVYQSICKEEQSFIIKKGIYDATDFSDRMAECAKYKDAIKILIDIGKALGDGFAWFFYKDSQQELDKQFNHKDNGLFPLGIGGKGEIEFIRSNQNLGGYFTLYHSITNMLRIGDFSLCTIDGKLVGVGELKSERQGNVLCINAYITSKVVIKAIDNPEETIRNVVPNPERLQRQLQQQEGFLKKEKISGFKADIVTDYQYDLIDKALSSNNMVSISDDKSMLVLLIREGGNLSSILLNDNNLDESYVKIIQTAVQEIIINGCSYNSLHFGVIDLKMSPFRKPIIWWELNDEIIKQIIFKQLQVLTVVNLGHFYDRLEKMGYTIEETDTTVKNGMYRISRKMGKGVSRLEEPKMFIDLIYHDFIKMDTIIDTIDKYINEAAGLGRGNIKVNLCLHQNTFGRPSAG